MTLTTKASNRCGAQQMPKKSADFTEISKQLRCVPQKLMLRLFGAGEQEGVVLKRFEQAWGIPVGSATSDLFAVFQAFRAFFTKHGTVLRQMLKSGDFDPALATRLQQARVRKVEADAEATELRNNQKARITCDVRIVHEFLERLSERYQAAAQQAQRDWGIDGFELFNGLQASLQDDLQQLSGNSQSPSSESEPLTEKKKSRRSKK